MQPYRNREVVSALQLTSEVFANPPKIDAHIRWHPDKSIAEVYIPGAGVTTGHLGDYLVIQNGQVYLYRKDDFERLYEPKQAIPLYVPLTSLQCQVVANALHFGTQETTFDLELDAELVPEIKAIEKAILSVYPELESPQYPGEVSY